MKAEIHSLRGWVDSTDPAELKAKYTNLLKDSKFDILSFQEHFFTPAGYTALWLLGESHFALHTFPEEGKTYVELSSCNKSYLDYFKSKTTINAV